REDREAQAIVEQAERVLATKGRHEHGNREARVISEPKVWEPAVQRYLEGDLPGAVAVANSWSGSRGKRKELLGELGEFGDLHRKVDDRDPKGLKRALQLDGEIGEGRGMGRLAKPMGIRLASQLYKHAAAAKAAGQWASAKDLARQVLAADPSHA